jgi:hypothetical protein
VPTLADLSWPWVEGTAYALLTGGVGLLAAAALFGDVAVIHADAALLALGALAFALVLIRILGYLSPRFQKTLAALVV